ncbi:hypothetical protein G7Z17_g7260 [Cylindrodendrum hubeiense]|uniref:Carboxylesterase type B domain-containing protein n=1 Tax=Cylindrodendrum hubeiense TaxID=595255 RepID=A0A9P5HDI6_9HYPO|nr:hypothetical protein G7Z17_g7260 [Cylindrodendrum hubeiense]
MVAEYSFNHSQLGELIGLERKSEIVQFRGIPFAQIPARFRQSVLSESLPSKSFDSRQPGGFCPQPFQWYPGFWTGTAPEDFPRLEASKADELGCLNLDITAPRTALEGGRKLPVLVFIHGGAFIGGSKSIELGGREVFDGFNVVRTSVDRKQDVIIVTINYRVGVLGFLASKELEAFNKSHGEAVGNYGLHDQARALDWINKFVGGFGGDPENVTIHGTSAGGSSVHYQTLFSPGKFKRAIASSGTMVGIGPRSLSEHQAKFQTYVDKFRDPESEPTQTIDLLQSIPADELVAHNVWTMASPLIDGVWIRGNTMDTLSVDNPPELMIGSCDYERDLFGFILSDSEKTQPQPDDKILQIAREICSANGMLREASTFPASCPAIVEAYGISNALDRPSTAFDGWVALLADVTFRVPPVHVASQHQGSSVFLYEITATNPFVAWPHGYGKANHGVNDSIFFNVAEDQVPAKHLKEWQGAVAAIQGAWLDFCNGQKPWPAFDKEQLGPIYRFENGNDGVLCHSLNELVGEQDAGATSSGDNAGNCQCTSIKEAQEDGHTGPSTCAACLHQVEPADTLTAIADQTVSDQKVVYLDSRESSLEANPLFPNMFPESPNDGQKSKSLEAKIELITIEDAIDTHPTQDSSEQEPKNDVNTQFLLPSLPFLFPVYLPFKAQHKLMVEVQKRLEHLCYAFGQMTMKETLERRGWDCAESAELNDWMDEFLQNRTIFVDMGADYESLEKLFQSVAEIRHTTVLRKRIDSKGIRKFMLDAQDLAELLNVKEHLTIISNLQLTIRVSLLELEENKGQLQSQLNDKLSVIAEKRARLDQVEKAAIAELRKKDYE